MSELTDTALMQVTTFERMSKVTSIDIIALCQRYEAALQRIADQPEPLTKKIAEQALGIVKVEHNYCKTCHAGGDGPNRAGMLINDECMNCHTTRKTGDIFIDATLRRSDEELKRTMDILT